MERLIFIKVKELIDVYDVNKIPTGKYKKIETWIRSTDIREIRSNKIGSEISFYNRSSILVKNSAKNIADWINHK